MYAHLYILRYLEDAYILGADRLISLVFDCVDHKQPDDQFRVTLDVSDTGRWEGKSRHILFIRYMYVSQLHISHSCEP